MRGTFENVAVVAMVSVCLAGCGQAGQQNMAPMQMDTSVPSGQQQLLNNDFQVLQNTYLAQPSPDQLQIMDIPDIQPTSLQIWLQTRIRLVVGEGFNWQQQGTEMQAGNALPEITSDTQLSDSSVETVMQNLGAMLYLQGRQSNGLYLLNTSMGQYRVNSPRVGLVQIGAGLFDGTNSIPDSDPSSQANTFLRLAVVYHEARHGDGNGDHAAFPHAICTSGDYAGDSACEENLNGPYAVQAFLLEQFYDACSQCSDTDAQGFLVLLADYQGRVLPDAIMRDDRPESLP